MDIFNSPWLLNMLAKSSKTPQGRILSLFDILGDWLNAPNIDLELTQEAIPNQALIVFCTAQAKAFGAANPAILAEHIVLIARNAAQQEIAHPGSNSLVHAKKAAHALILAQSQREWPNSKPAIFSIAASFILLIGASVLWLPTLIDNYYPQTLLAKNNNIKLDVAKPNAALTGNNLTAQDAVVMYAKYEQMRNGTCQFPEAIQIPDKHKAIYLENVVAGKLPTDLNDLTIANFYLEKVRCNFTPMLMARSK
ncbi:MAG TPA: hypothetical protein VES38_00100 [Methylotenera sp.]|nr:hypothetical protein [Methylotenera sp.]